MPKLLKKTNSQEEVLSTNALIGEFQKIVIAKTSKDDSKKLINSAVSAIGNKFKRIEQIIKDYKNDENGDDAQTSIQNIKTLDDPDIKSVYQFYW